MVDLQSGRPVSVCTPRELADEVMKREYVESISASTVQRWLKSARLRPHRSTYWLNTKEKDRDKFDAQVRHVCAIWQDAERLCRDENIHVVSVDDIPGPQALERATKTIPMTSGCPQRIGFEYKRHGTLCLIGNWHVARGQLISPTDFTNDSADANRRRSAVALSLHSANRPERQLGIRRRSAERALQRVVGLLDRKAGRHRSAIAREEGKARRVKVDGVASGVPVRSESSHSFCVSSETFAVAESD